MGAVCQRLSWAPHQVVVVCQGPWEQQTTQKLWHQETAFSAEAEAGSEACPALSGMVLEGLPSGTVVQA
eukprot:870734-Prorocentrum_lima.AAC.1